MSEIESILQQDPDIQLLTQRRDELLRKADVLDDMIQEQVLRIKGLAYQENEELQAIREELAKPKPPLRINGESPTNNSRYRPKKFQEMFMEALKNLNRWATAREISEHVHKQGWSTKSKKDLIKSMRDARRGLQSRNKIRSHPGYAGTKTKWGLYNWADDQ